MIAAVVLAAGLSTRMGRPKMPLAWGESTVIGQVINVLVGAELEEIVVVVGGSHEQVEEILQEMPVRLVFNPQFTNQSMVCSLQAGLSSMPSQIHAVMIVLGDQPQIQVQVVRDLLSTYNQTRAKIVIPSYRMRRGHPWIVDRSVWTSIMNLEPPQTLRNLLEVNANEIKYVNVKTDSILRDLDTPQDYDQERPKKSMNGG